MRTPLQLSSSAISAAQAMWRAMEIFWHCSDVHLRVDHVASSRCCERESLLPTSSDHSQMPGSHGKVLVAWHSGWALRNSESHSQ